MQALLLEDHFQDVFQDFDPEDAELVAEEPVEAMKESGAGLISSKSGHTTTDSERKLCSQLRRNEREQVVETLKNVTGAILLDRVVK